MGRTVHTAQSRPQKNPFCLLLKRLEFHRSFLPLENSAFFSLSFLSASPLDQLIRQSDITHLFELESFIGDVWHTHTHTPYASPPPDMFWQSCEASIITYSTFTFSVVYSLCKKFGRPIKKVWQKLCKCCAIQQNMCTEQTHPRNHIEQTRGRTEGREREREKWRKMHYFRPIRIVCDTLTLHSLTYFPTNKTNGKPLYRMGCSASLRYDRRNLIEYIVTGAFIITFPCRTSYDML